MGDENISSALQNEIVMLKRCQPPYWAACQHLVQALGSFLAGPASALLAVPHLAKGSALLSHVRICPLCT